MPVVINGTTGVQISGGAGFALSGTGQFDVNSGITQAVVAVAASNIDCSLGNYFTKTASGGLTWTISNIPASRSFSFVLELTNGGSGTQVWFSNTKWPNGLSPTLTTSGVDLLGFLTDDSGATWKFHR